jgi:hypothetical protein
MPSLSHKQTELCICGNVVLYINSASYIAEMVLQCAIQMSDIPKDIKKLSNEDINNCAILVCFWNRRGRYRMVVGFVTTNVISAYHM